WWFGGSDSGDLVSAAAEPGVPHPTGYPLFIVLGHLATLIPGAEPAARVNALNALLAALAVGAVAATIAALAPPASKSPGSPGMSPTPPPPEDAVERELAGRRPAGEAPVVNSHGDVITPVAAAVAALATGTSSLFWSQAIIGEVYALHAALVALCLWLWA